MSRAHATDFERVLNVFKSGFSAGSCLYIHETHICDVSGKSNEPSGQIRQGPGEFTPTRRAVLAAGGGVALSALAGCSSFEDGTGTDSRATDDPSLGGTGTNSRDGVVTTTTSVPGGKGSDWFFKFDEADGTLTITFLGGRFPPATQIEIQGEHIGGVSGVWIDLPGAEASETVNGAPALDSQDSVTLGAADGQGPVESNYVVELVFVDKDGTRTIIASDRGPDA